MRDLTAIIEGIQAVRQARRQFLRLWRLERLPACLASAPAALDRLAADIARAGNALGDLAGSFDGARDRPDLTSTRERAILKSRTTWLYPHGRLADEWE
jgi:hypothetical protein